MITGTSYFPTTADAYRYYAAMGETLRGVCDKIDAGEIHIGKPPLKAGETLQLIDDRTRWAIVES
jgi:hypothetical protein